MAMILVNGHEVLCPSEFEWSLQDISQSDSGRDETGLMYKGLIAKKRKIKLSWWAKRPADASAILAAFQDEYFDVTYPDALSGETETRTFYRGDQTAPIYWWYEGKERYSKISFDLIER